MDVSGTISAILGQKSGEIFSVTPDTTVHDAVAMMDEKNVGAVLVMKGSKLVGMLSERDYTRKVMLRGKKSADTKVSEIMSSKLTVAHPNEGVEECLRVMTDKRFRHLPVLDGEKVVGVMQAAYEAALSYANERRVFGKPLVDYQLTRVKLARMAVIVQAARQFSYKVARLMAKGEGTVEASLIKAYVCRAAEWVTREAMQIHGGMGYAEEYDVSRYFVDARVLSIFEGADETLALRVIARRLVEQAAP